MITIKEFDMTMRHCITLTSMLILAGVFAGCDGSAIKPTSTGGAVIPASHFIVGDKPANAPMLTEVKAESKVGDKVMFEARVGGRSEVFVKDVAIFMAADPRLVSCDQRPGDHCSVPWDYCCEDSTLMKAGTATIQIMNDVGTPYAVSAENQGGIKPLKTVVIQGVVSAKDENGVFVVDANNIWVGTIPSEPPAPETEAEHSHDHDHEHEHG